MDETAPRDPSLIAELNDLLQLDHDALQAYQVAIENLENESYRETLRQFRGDHERHIDDLTALIRAKSGAPRQRAHLTTGVFKLMLQQLGRAGGDTGILLAFELNERQVRDKYWRHADRAYTRDIIVVLRRNAEDEERHYSWVIESLRRTGPGQTALTEQAKRVISQIQARVTDLAEGTEREVREQVDRLVTGFDRQRS